MEIEITMQNDNPIQENTQSHINENNITSAVIATNESVNNNNVVNTVVNELKDSQDYALCIAPEGTRRSVERIRSGFYYIAKELNVPVVYCLVVT